MPLDRPFQDLPSALADQIHGRRGRLSFLPSNLVLAVWLVPPTADTSLASPTRYVVRPASHAKGGSHLVSPRLWRG